MSIRRNALPREALASALVVGMLGIALAAPAEGSREYVQATIDEIPTAVAVADSGVIAGSLYDAQAIALVDPDGTVRQALLDCPPVDVAIAPDGATAWAVCQESNHLNVVDVVSLEVTLASTKVGGLDSIDYLPAVDELIIGSLEGWVLAVTEVSSGGYALRRWSQFPQDGPHRITQVAPLGDGTGAYAITDSGDLAFADLLFGVDPRIIKRASSGRSFQSVATSPFGTALYAVVIDSTRPQIVTTVEVVDMATGDARQSVPLAIAGGLFPRFDLAAGFRALYLTAEVNAETPWGSNGLLTLPVSSSGRIGDVRVAPVALAQGSATAVSADFTRVAFGTTGRQVLGIVVDDRPYPASVRISAQAKGTRFTISGSATSMPVLTELVVFTRDLTKKASTFKKHAKRATVNFQGDIAWSGKPPSKRFAVFISGAGAKSNTVTVTAR